MAAKVRRWQRIVAIWISASLVAACGVISPQPVIGKIALLAPFEGRYRDVGYEALYAARLAFHDYADLSLDLLPIDDGGTPALAEDRANALRQDPTVHGVLLLGYNATTASAQVALADLPTVIVGNWHTEPIAHTVIMSSPEAKLAITWRQPLHEIGNSTSSIIGTEVLSLPQVQFLSDNLSDIVILSSGSLPSNDFLERYQGDDPFAPDPRLLATLTYDATALLIESLQSEQPLNALTHEGINGPIRFENGYWVDAPLHLYQYDATGTLLQLD